MLIEFRVKNFRSLRDEQVLSLVASPDKTLRTTNTLETHIKAAPALLRSAAIYGANASGKSNLIKALQYMRRLVVESAGLPPEQAFAVRPFLLDGASPDSPTEFEVTFLLDGVRYQYGFALIAERIVSEHLLVYKAFKPQRWFERHFDADSQKDVYEVGPALKGPTSTWEGATRPNALFLSMAVQLNSEQLFPVFSWFVSQLVVINESSLLSPGFVWGRPVKPGDSEGLCDFLKAADISIARIEEVTNKAHSRSLRFDLASGKADRSYKESEQTELRFHHQTPHGTAIFGLEDESSGTRNLVALAGPMREVLHQGLTLVIDELDTSLHPLLVRRLVRLFHEPSMNTGGAQLIFTTHDASLLDAPDLLRRDQIWLVEKDTDQASRLVSLSEFSPRKNEALERGYLMGRYGGIPFLGDLPQAAH